MDRIVELGKKVWSLLTEDERERYYNTVGTLSFVEDIATIIGYDIDADDTSIDDIHDQIIYAEKTKIMTRKETLERVADELRCNVDDRFGLAMLTIVETLAEMWDDPSNISWSCGNIGIDVVSNHIAFVDIEAGKTIFTLDVNHNG